MNTRHTPGPWKIEQGTNGDAVITHSDTELRSHVARIYAATLCPEHGTVEDNARLIAAAPDLLEALQAIAGKGIAGLPERFDDLTTVNVPVLVKAIWDARAAITKATGQQ